MPDDPAHLRDLLATGLGEPASTDWTPPEPAALAGVFPRLEVIALIGRGGMGAVYRARQTHLDRTVALKLLAPRLCADPAFTERFRREAVALARLAHPHIVAVHDVGEAGGWHYLVMEHVEGATLRQAMATGRCTAAEALALAPQLCDALAYAHAQGVVHRDLKPENILLDGHGRARIADFGLAKLRGPDGASSAGHAGITRSGQLLGTAAYMAPEQIAGAAVDHRADLYALGVIIYEMLTGSLPLGRFEAPSRRVEVDVRLDEVVLRALERTPERRWQSAAEVRKAMGTLEQPPRAGGVRTRTLAVVGAGAALLGAGVAVGAMLLLTRIEGGRANERQTHARRPPPAEAGTPIPDARGTPIPELKRTPIPDAQGTPIPELKRTPIPDGQGTPIPTVDRALPPDAPRGTVPEPIRAAAPAPAVVRSPQAQPAAAPDPAPADLPAPAPTAAVAAATPLPPPAPVPAAPAAEPAEPALPRTTAATDVGAAKPPEPRPAPAAPLDVSLLEIAGDHVVVIEAQEGSRHLRELPTNAPEHLAVAARPDGGLRLTSQRDGVRLLVPPAQVRRIVVTGKATALLRGLRGEALTLVNDGTGRIEATGLAVARLEATAHGRGPITLAGSATALIAEATLVHDDPEARNPNRPALEVSITDGQIVVDGDSGARPVIDARALVCESIDGTCGSSGMLRLAGRVKGLRLLVNGRGQLDAANLDAASATIDHLGSAHLRLGRFDELAATCTGSGSLRYAGNPRLVRPVAPRSSSVSP